jgi:FAD/FMN-containing dehydrogenase
MASQTVELAADLRRARNDLAPKLAGSLLFPEDPGYDAARQLWNGRIDKRPTLFVRCATAADVAEAVRFAGASGVPTTVRGGGHNIAGNSLCNGGIVIDLSAMKGIEIDRERRTARAEPGLRLGEFDAATQAHGLATTMGVASDTGIAGLTLGGGLGRLARKYGTACDNLLAAEIVLADGRRVVASAEENGDLFWGLRGGGGNFGIVTTFTYRLHPVGPTLLGGLLLHDFARAREVLRFYRDFCLGAPDEVSADAALLTGPNGHKVVAISASYIGPVAEGERALRPLREFGPPLADEIAPTAYTKLQSSADALFLPGRRYYWKTHLLRTLGDAAIDTLVDHVAVIPSALSIVVVQQFGGAVTRVDPAATAYANRDAAFDCIPICAWEDPAEDDCNIAWGRALWEAMRPYSDTVYVNNLGEEGEDRVRAAFGANYERLAALKRRYDPTNFFRFNQNIDPGS